MNTATKALIICTAASLVAVLATTIATGAQAWAWIVWAVLAAVTVAVTVADKRAGSH